jgi:hypothetical protein
MKRLAPLFCALIFTNGFAAEWSQVRSSAGKNSVEISSPRSKIALRWESQIVPGSDLLFSTSTYGGETFYSRYLFLGVTGGSIQLRVSVARGAARTDPNSDQLRFVEQAVDGSFYFVPTELQDDGYIWVTRSAESPGRYELTVVKSPR